MSDVVDLAIRRLEDEADHLNEEVADLDTIDAIARRQMREKYSHTFTADSTAQELVLELCNLNKKPEKLHFTIEDLTVKYFLPQKEALDSLTAANFGFKLLIDGFYTSEPPADSTLYFAEPPRIK